MKFRLWTLIFFVLLFFLFLLPTIDTDFGWQLRCGRELLATGKLCSPDRYSVLLPGYQWAYPVQVFPVLLALVFDHLGWWGLSVMNAVVMGGTFVILFQLLGDPSTSSGQVPSTSSGQVPSTSSGQVPSTMLRTSKREIGEVGGIWVGVWMRIVVILAIVYFSWGVLGLGLRSQMLSIFFFVLSIYLVERPKLWWMFPLVFLIWVNTHGGFVLGLFIVGVYWVESAIRLLLERGKREKGDKWGEIWRLSVIGLSSLSATFVSPFTWRVYQEDWLHFGGGYRLAGLIAEWVPPAPQILVAIFFFSIASLFLLVRRGEKRISFYLLLVVMTYLGVSARRNVPYSLITAVYVARGKIGESGVMGVIGRIGVIGLFFYTFFIQFPKTARINTSWTSYCTEGMLVYPCQASEFMKTQKSGRLFATYEWGGFLIWQLPDFPSFVDGRMPAWITPEGKSPYTIYLETIRTEGNWQQRLADYHLDYIFIQPGTFMDLKLRPNPEELGWREIYRDGVTVVYRKSV